MPYQAGGVIEHCFYRGPVDMLGLLGPRKGGGTIKKAIWLHVTWHAGLVP
jgi:hypothetical protein